MMLKSCVIFSEALHNIFKKDYTHDSRGINCFMNRNSLKKPTDIERFMAFDTFIIIIIT